MYFHAAELVPGVFIGSFHAAEDAQWLKENNIQTILSVCEQKAKVPEALEEDHTQLVSREGTPLEDRLFDNELTPEDFWRFMSKAADSIVESMDDEKNILIYCNEGVNRSVAAGIAYLILYEDATFDEAFKQANDANMNRTKAFLQISKLELPEEQITFPTLTNSDFGSALKFLKGAFEEGDSNKDTLDFYAQWEETYMKLNTSMEEVVA